MKFIKLEGRFFAIDEELKDIKKGEIVFDIIQNCIAAAQDDYPAQQPGLTARKLIGLEFIQRFPLEKIITPNITEGQVIKVNKVDQDRDYFITTYNAKQQANTQIFGSLKSLLNKTSSIVEEIESKEKKNKKALSFVDALIADLKKHGATPFQELLISLIEENLKIK